MKPAGNGRPHQDRRAGAPYLRPLVLIQSEPRRAGVDTLDFEKVRLELISNHGIPASEIIVATGDERGLEQIDADYPGGIADPACPVFDDPVVLSNLEGTVLNELSGLAASRIHEGVLWAHNDSGDSARIFAVVPDLTAPALTSVQVISPTELRLLFNELLDATSTGTAAYTLAPGGTVFGVVNGPAPLTTVILTLDAPLVAGVLYTITVGGVKVGGGGRAGASGTGGLDFPNGSM